MNSIITKLILLFSLLLLSCTEKNEKWKEEQSGIEDVALNPEKDAAIQQSNLEHKKKFLGQRSPCDTLSLIDFVLNNYPKGTYLVESDKTVTYNIPKPAVVYFDKNYILCVIAKSKEGERLIEVKNIVGYDQSFIDLDSTELGTAFFFLTLLECYNGSFQRIWESPIPSHGGFNNMKLEKWQSKNIQYIKVNFHYAQGTGHIDYNYFLVDGITNPPHLMMTYEGIDFKRTITNLNDDSYPDYLEYLYYDLGNRVYPKDSIVFVWDTVKNVYVNTRNSKQTRLY
jgi:hypothetical protein